MPPRSRRPCWIGTNWKPLSSDRRGRSSSRRPRSPPRNRTAIRFRTGRLFRIRYSRNSHRLLPQLRAGVAGQLGEPLAVRLEHVRTCRGSATARRTRWRTARTAGRRSSASTSASSCLRQLAARGQLQRRRVRRAVPQEVRQLRCQFVVVERLGVPACCCSRSGTGTAASQHDQQRVLHARSGSSLRSASDFSNTANSDGFFLRR